MRRPIGLRFTTNIPRYYLLVQCRTLYYRCEGGDLNPYSFRNQLLILARMPVSPPSLYFVFGTGGGN